MHVFGTWLENLLGNLNNPALSAVLLAAGKVLAIIVAAFLAVRIGSFIIRKLFKKRKIFRDGRKMETLVVLSVSILRYTVYIIAAVIILSDVFQLKSVLAAAGVGGLALGLGIQNLIRDVISGFFILMENQFSVGDVITVENMNGTVEELGFRITKLRGFSGDLHMIPNGEIRKVTNHSRGNRAIIVDIPLAYGVDMDKAFEIANKVCLQVSEDRNMIVQPLEILGITELGNDRINLRIVGASRQNEQQELEMTVRRRIVEQFKMEGLEVR